MLNTCLPVYRFFRQCLIVASISLFIFIPIFSQDGKKTDSLKARLTNSTAAEKLNILNDLFKAYNQVDYQIAFNYAMEFDNLAKKMGDSVKIVEGGRKMAYSLMDLGKNDEAIKILIEILKIAERNKEQYPELKKQIKFILNNAGIAYNYLGNYDKALEYHYKSLLIREEEGDKKSIGTALNNLGMVFYDLKDPNKAIEYYIRAIQIKIELRDNSDLDRIFINLGICYNQLGDFKLATKQFDEGFNVCKENCSDNVKREGLLGLGIAHLGTKNLEKAENCFLQSLEISKKQHNSIYQINNYHQLSLLESSRGNDEKALAYLEEELVLAEGSDFVEPLIQLYDQFAKIYSKEHNYEKMAYYLNKYTQLKDSIYSDELIKNLAKVQTNYAERENIKTIYEQDQVLQLKQQLIERQRNQYIFIVAITLLVLGLATVLLVANRKQQRVSAELSMAKVKIQDQNQLLAAQNKQLDKRVKDKTADLSKTNLMLTQVNSELDNFLYKTSHDIRGPLMTLQGLCNLGLIESKDQKVTEILGKLGVQSEKMANILSRLTAVGKVNQSVLSPVKIDFKKLLTEISLTEEKKCKESGVNFSYTIDANVSVISDSELLRTILENLIDNGIKFYNNSVRVSPFVSVSVSQTPAHLLIKVEDNGIGILDTPTDEVFHMFMRASERSETGGVGLYLSKICTDKLGGEIKLEKTSKEGTLFLVQLPLDISVVIEKRRQQTEDIKMIQEEISS